LSAGLDAWFTHPNAPSFDWSSTGPETLLKGWIDRDHAIDGRGFWWRIGNRGLMGKFRAKRLQVCIRVCNALENKEKREPLALFEPWETKMRS
tara:strand:- start:780 stop:1058 length:279 start_codon:yes stop_codon:yes gene_type:complete